VAPVPGFSWDYTTSTNPPGIVGVRNAYLPYPGIEGFKAGSDVALVIWLFNSTSNPVTVVLSTDAGTVKMEPITIAPAAAVTPKVVVTGLSRPIANGQSLPLSIEFVGHVKIAGMLPVAPPDQPGPREPMTPAEGGEGH
jgi:hypothetical protein